MASGEEAVSIARAIEIALTHRQAGRLSEAENIYRQVLAFDPHCFDATHMLGVVALPINRVDDALELMEWATALNPNSAQAFSNLGLAYRARPQLERAKSRFEKAVALDPAFTDARNNLASAYQAPGNSAAAIAEFEGIITLRPDQVDPRFNLAGNLQSQGRLQEAVARYDEALGIARRLAEGHLDRARALAKLRRRPEAIAGYRQALLPKPDLIEAHYRLGKLLQAQGSLAEALDCFECELAVNPSFVEARWARTMAQLPGVYDSNEASADFRGAFAASLAELDAWFVGDRMNAGVKAVGSHAPFYLAYDEQNNLPLLSRYGDLCARLMRHWQDAEGIALHAHADQGPIRVGIVSAHLRDHSVWTAIVKGWMQNIDRARVSLHVFDTGSVQDEETRQAETEADFFLRESSQLAGLARAIVDQRLDVIIYPEIGMDPMTIRLASMRLAPVQAVAWGHPETSGLPTIDYILSAECFEPADAQSNYRERLVALPHLGCHYRPLDIAPVDPDLHALNLDPDRPILVCPGTPYKYRPEHDRLFAEIARRVPEAPFVFFIDDDFENLSEKLYRRLGRAFANAGLRLGDHARFIPWLPKPAFFGLLAHADACLDTIGFSGFNTAMQVIQCGLPLVTLERRYMRGRLGSGIMRRMRLAEMIAGTEAEYVDLAVELATNPDFRARARERIEDARGILFDDLAPIRALEDFLVEATRSRHVAQP